MKKKWVPFIAITSTLSCILWMFGLSWVLYDYFNGSEATGIKPTKPEAVETVSTPPSEGYDILALGDSLTRGTGDVQGKGYVGYLVDSLKETSDRTIRLNNLGIKGQRSQQLVELVRQKEVQRQVENADLILITIGGNDLFQSGETLLDLNEQAIGKLESKYLDNLKLILAELRSINPKANIFIMGLYNPFSQLADGDLTSKIVRAWNSETSEVCAKYSNSVMVPTFDLFQLKVDKYLYTDKFHPNTEGYKLIAERVAALIEW